MADRWHLLANLRDVVELLLMCYAEQVEENGATAGEPSLVRRINFASRRASRTGQSHPHGCPASQLSPAPTTVETLRGGSTPHGSGKSIRAIG